MRKVSNIMEFERDSMRKEGTQKSMGSVRQCQLAGLAVPRADACSWKVTQVPSTTSHVTRRLRIESAGCAGGEASVPF